MNHKKQTHSGFTLIEIMLSIFIFGSIVTVVLSFAVYFFRNYSFSFEETQSISLAQTAVTKMVREIREAKTSETGTWPIITAEDNLFSFYSDVTNDGRSDLVRYFLSSNTLMRGVIEPTVSPISYPNQNETISIVASNIDLTSGSIFKYFNGAYPTDTVNNPLPQDNRIYAVRYIEIYITINITPDTGSTPYQIVSGVNVRSIKSNL